MRKRKIFARIILIINASIVFVVASYAWFSDKSNPSITQSNIKVSAAEGLVIKLSPDSAARTTVNLDEIFSDFDLFELQQMSSSDALNFYTIDFGAGLANNRPQYVKIIPEEDGLLNMEQYGCVDYDFYLQTENFAKHVYLHKDTGITGAASNAIRVAITVDDENYNVRYIFGDVKEDGSQLYPYTTRAVIAQGQFDYFETSSSNLLIDNQNVYTFDEKNGGRGQSDDGSIDLSKILFTIPAETTVKINVKIWLEGGDSDCDNVIAGSTIDATIKFGSANVLRDAPSVIANNSQLTITNLTTEMEYNTVSENSNNWQRVTNPSMTFRRRQTVYVRYYEVENVSAQSYITTVTFN